MCIQPFSSQTSFSPRRGAIGTIAFLLIVVLIISSSAAIGLMGSQSVVTMGSGSLQTCDEYAWSASTPTIGPGLQHEPVLLMRPNSTGYICVTYQTAWQGNQDLYQRDPTYNSYPFLVNGTYRFVYFVVANYKCGTNPVASCIQTISHSFQITALPSYVRPSASMDFFTVEYAITALGNSTGFYYESAPWTGCLGMPLAVGYSASQVNASDFTQPPTPLCLVQLFVPFSEYVTGMNVIYINALRA
jgi:hypothetical protein